MDFYYIGIDIGSTHIKALLINSTYQQIDIESMSNTPQRQTKLGLCYDANTIWNNLTQIVSTLTRRHPDIAIGGIGLTAMVDSFVPIDRNGNAMTEVIPWSSPDGSAFANEIAQHFTAKKLWQLTGQIVSPKRAYPRLRLLEKAYPDIVANMDGFISLYDYILLRLTGKRITDNSVACRTMLYDIHAKQWDPDLCRFAKLDGKLPKVLQLGEQAGSITSESSSLLGICEGVPVYCGGHDHICAFHALHLAGYRLLNSMGTAEVFTGILHPGTDTQPLMDLGISLGCFTGDTLYWLANLPSSGICYEWLKNISGHAEDNTYSSILPPPNYCACEQNLFFIPYLNGSGTPTPNPTPRARYYGLSASTTIPQMAAAIGEGLAFETRRITDTLSRHLNIAATGIVAAGGGTRNDHLISCKASLSNADYHICHTSELSAFGAALFASQATSLSLQTTPVIRHPIRSVFLEKNYSRYLHLCKEM